jgi:hypothetical protein
MFVKIAKRAKKITGITIFLSTFSAFFRGHGQTFILSAEVKKLPKRL